MRISYDAVADVMYIYFSEKKKSSRSEEIGEDIVVDYAGKELIGIEILDASKKLPDKDLNTLTITVPTYRGKVISPV